MSRPDPFTDRSGTDPVRAARFLLLAWVACCDGELDGAERALLEELGGGLGPAAGELLELARRPDDAALASAAWLVRGRMSRLLREPFLRLALSVVLADGVVRRPEADLLLFLADLFELSRTEFEALFLEAAGRPFPRRWGGSGTEPLREPAPRGDEDPRRAALAVLGLEEGADRDAVRRAYRELAAAHHPDRFAALGADAVQAARLGFLRVQRAYETLGA